MKIWEIIELNLNSCGDNQYDNPRQLYSKICYLQSDYKVADKSSFALLQESKFANFDNNIENKTQDYLSQHKTLIDKWEIWSEGKRTWGYYLSIGADKYFVS